MTGAEKAAMRWHKKSHGRYRSTIHRSAWVEVSRLPSTGKWHVYGVCWPTPKFIRRLAGPFDTMRDAKAAAEARVLRREQSR